MSKTFDLKVGYSCNNNCVHCVIKPNVMDLQKQGLPINYNYKEIIDFTNSHDFKCSDSVILTGGEISIRKDMERIVNYIHTNYPEKRIHIQSNGRNLKPFIEKFKDYNISYVIAVHSHDEKTHNDIVANDNAKVGENPYRETIETLKEIIKHHGNNLRSYLRIEIVLSLINLSSIKETVAFLHEEMGINHIGISYPHLDGFYNVYGADYLKKISFSYKELKPQVIRLYEYLKLNPSLEVAFEQVPRCIYQVDGYELPTLKNISSMGHVAGEDVAVMFPGGKYDEDFVGTWTRLHKKGENCVKCFYNDCCFGVWFEAIDTFGDEGLEPIKKGCEYRC